MEKVTYVGLDVHKRFIQVAMVCPGSDGYVEWRSDTTPAALRRFVRRLKREAMGELSTCYEAGPCGYELQRYLEKEKIACVVVAPSRIPKASGERIKTDRRDARKLARLLRSGDLVEVLTPTPEQEVARDLARAREAARVDLGRCRHRLGKWLLRQGRVYTKGKTAWTKMHYRWLRQLTFDDPVAQEVFDTYRMQVEQQEDLLKRLDAALGRLAQQAPYAEPVGYLRCFRGIDTTTAIILVLELYGFGRFDSPRHLMGYLGLVPREHSSGGKGRRGQITKLGPGYVRRILVEAGWQARHKVCVPQALARRREGQPGWVISIADRASRRLYRRYWQLSNRRKMMPKVVVAVARELVGFLWEVLYRQAMGALPDEAVARA
jgi:transposase